MEGNITFAKLTRVADRKHVRPFILTQLYSSAFAIINATSNLTYFIVFAQIVSTFHKIALVSLSDVELLSHIEVFNVVQSFLNYMNPDELLRQKDSAIALALVCVGLFVCLLTLGCLLLPKRTKPLIKRIVYQIGALLFVIGLPLLGPPIYMTFISQLDCWNRSYHDECWTPIHLANFIMSAIGTLTLLALTAFYVLFFYVDNFILSWPFNGSAKLWLILNEVEKLILILIYIIDPKKVFHIQFLVVMLVLFVVKMYMEFNSHPFYERRIVKSVLFLEAFFTGRIIISLSIRFSYKSAENWTFLAIFMMAIVFGSISYVIRIEYERLRDISPLSPVKNEGTLIDILIRLIILFRHQNSDHSIRQKLINYFSTHVDICQRQSSCSCRKVLDILIENNPSEHRECRQSFFTFLTEVISEYQRVTPKTANLHLIKLFIEFVELGKILPVAFQMKFIQSQKLSWNGLFNIFILE